MALDPYQKQPLIKRVQKNRGPAHTPSWAVLIKPAFIGLFAVMSFLLVHSMTHHRFFRGGPYVSPYRNTLPYNH